MPIDPYSDVIRLTTDELRVGSFYSFRVVVVVDMSEAQSEDGREEASETRIRSYISVS